MFLVLQRPANAWQHRLPGLRPTYFFPIERDGLAHPPQLCPGQLCPLSAHLALRTGAGRETKRDQRGVGRF